MKKDEKKKINKFVILIAVIVIITLFIGIVFIYMPFLNKKKSLRAEILQERDRNVLIGKIRAIGKHLKVYDKRIPEHRGVSWLLSVVSGLASKEQIEVSSIKPGAPESRGLYTKLYVVADTISTYDQLGKFLSRIESSEKFLKVENIEVHRLDLDKDFKEDISKFKPYDAEGHIVISTVVLKE